MIKIAFVIFNGIEDTEFVLAHDVFCRAGYDSHIFGVNESKSIVTKTGLDIPFKHNIDSIDVNSFDMLYLSGGPGITDICENEKILKIVKEFDKEGKMIAAICAAPMILVNSKVISGKKHTCHPSVYDYCNDKTGSTVKDDVVIEGNIFTAKNFTKTFDFSMNIVEKISGKDFSDKLKVGF